MAKKFQIGKLLHSRQGRVSSPWSDRIFGFINSILDSVGDAENAAAMIGMSAASSLEQTISEISGDAADQMSISGSSRRNEAEALAAENEKTAMTYSGRNVWQGFDGITF